MQRSFSVLARSSAAVIGTTASLWWSFSVLARSGAAVIGTTASLWAFAAPAHALCPNCLGQNASWTPTLRIIGVFLLIPPAIFFFVARLIRRLDR